MSLVSFAAKADQYAVLNQQQAKQVKDYLLKNKVEYIVSFCDCCDNDQPELIKIKKIGVATKPNEPNDYYLVIIYEKNGKEITKDFDLAYLYLKNGDTGMTFAQALGWKQKMCATKPFDWIYKYPA